MTQAWTDDVARYLLDSTICPRCGSLLTELYWCAACEADLTGSQAAGIQTTTRAVIAGLKQRQEFIAGLRTRPRAAPPAASAVDAPAAPSAAIPSGAIPSGAVPSGAVPSGTAPHAAPSREGSSLSVQSVLAVAGAALVAVAAIVFTFLNPDLTDFGTRTAIVAIVTVVFLGSAWLLVRTGLQFSAEAVGALGMVFVALDIWAFSSLAPALSGWIFAGIGTLVGSAVMIAIAVAARIRSWLWAGLVGVTISPAFFGYAGGDPWVATLGHLGVGVAALAIPVILPRLHARFSSGLRLDRATSTVIEFLVLAVVLIQIGSLPRPQTVDLLGVTLILLALAVLAAANARHGIWRVWSFLSGGLVAAACALVPFAFPSSTQQLALLPTAAVGALLVLAALPTPTTVHRLMLVTGAWAVALAVTFPAALLAISRAATPLTSRDSFFDDAALSMAALLGVAATAVGCGLLWMLLRRRSSTAGLARAALVTGLWLAVLSVLALVAWIGFSAGLRAALGLGVVLVLGLTLWRVPRVSSAPRMARLPIIVGAHLILLSTATLAWTESSLTVAVGAAVVALVALLARAVAAAARPWYFAVGYGYALIVFAAGLSLLHIETIAVLCLTTTLASLTALAATLAHRLAARHWYAVLLVTAVPFLVGIASVLTVRSGWTALSTAVTFALALTLLLTRRTGLNRAVRSTAAALLVPAVSVVVICLGAQLLRSSGSPVVLPIIAVIVACVLPSTGIIGAALVRHGIPHQHATLARLAIEASTLVTAVVAVALALVRSAAGLGTTFVVLLIIGLGAAVMAYVMRRSYGWALAFVCGTGALWCVWALSGVTVAEPYILPPALIAAGIAAVLVGRGRPGIGVPAIGQRRVADPGDPRRRG